MIDDTLAPPPATPVTQAVIAARCGVRQATVSRALRGDPRISAETIERIRRAAERLGYQPTQHAAARTLAIRRHGGEPRHRSLAMLIPGMQLREPYFAAMAQGLVWQATREGFRVHALFTPGDDRAALLRDPPPMLAGGEVDGLVILPAYDAIVDLVRTLRRSRFGDRPIVALISPLSGCSSVSPDARHSGYLAAKHLIELGHRRLLQLVHPGYAMDPNLRARLEGVGAALREAGLDPARDLVRFVMYDAWCDPTTLGRGQGNDGARLLATLRENPGCTGIVGYNDAAAIQAIYALRAGGVRVPEDVSVIGLDDTHALLDDSGRNTLTTIACPLEEVGRMAARVVMREAQAPHEREDVRLPVRIVERLTTAAPAARRAAG